MDGNENTVEIGGKERKTNLVLEDAVHHDRWELIKKIAEVYDKQEKRANGKLRWAKPLCDLELCTMSSGNSLSSGHNLSAFQKEIDHYK